MVHHNLEMLNKFIYFIYAIISLCFTLLVFIHFDSRLESKFKRYRILIYVVIFAVYYLFLLSEKLLLKR